MEIYTMKQTCAPAVKPRLAMPIAAAAGVAARAWDGATVQKHAAFGATGPRAWSPPSC